MITFQAMKIFGANILLIVTVLLAREAGLFNQLLIPVLAGVFTLADVALMWLDGELDRESNSLPQG
jgi:D-serine dehydratase